MKKPLRVLIVEDSADDAELIVIALSSGGYNPSWTRIETEAEMRVALTEGAWDVVLSDYTLPSFGAAQALAVARQADLDLPFLIISGTIGEEMAVAMVRAGANDYLLKDSLVRLVAAVERELREAASRRAGRAAELLAQDVLDSLPAHVAVLDAQGQIIGVNEAWKRFARANGATDESMYGIGTNYLKVCRRAGDVDSAEAAPAESGISRVLSGEIPSFSFEYPCHSLLEQRWFLLHASPLRPIGRGVVVSHTDITERKRAEVVDRRLASIVESSADAIISENLDGTISSWNPAAERLYGWTAEEAVGRHVSFLAPPEKIEEHAAILNRVLRGDQVKSFETVRMHKDGTRIDVAITHSRLQDKHGGLIGITKVVRDIRERRRAEEALRASETRFRKMADAAPVIIWVTDSNYSCTYLNSQWYNFTGQTEESALGFGWLDATHPDDRLATESVFREASKRHEPFLLEYRLRAGDGSYRWCMDTGTPQFSEDGSFIGYIGSVTDITIRHQAEVIIRASEERLRLALKAGRMGTYDWDIVTNKIEWSDTHYELFGYSSEHKFPVEFRHFADRLHPADLPIIEAALQRAMTERTDYVNEARVLLPDGTIRWVLGNGKFSYDATGRAVRMLGTVIDITERRRMEEAVRASEDQLRAIFDTAAAGIAVTAADGRFVRCNSAYCQMVGYSESELRQIDFATLTHPDDRPRNLQLLKDLLNEKIPSFSIEKRYIHKSGSLVWSRVGVSAMRDKTRQPNQIIGVAEDITRQKFAEEELRQNRDYLRMASRVSHVGAWTVELPEPRLTWSEEIYAIFEFPAGPPPDLETAIGFYCPGYCEVIRTEFARCANDGIPFDLELEIVTAAGRRRWVRSIGEGVRDASGTIVRVQGACQDITESRQAREREQRLVARLAETLENISDAFVTLDTDWNLTFVNGEVEKLTCKNRKELLGTNIWSAFPEAIGSAFERHYRRAVDERVTVEFEEFFAPLNTWFAVKAYPTPEGLAVYCKDVTQQRIAEEAVRESAERFRLLARGTNDAIWDWNLITNQLWWNEGYETMFGYHRTQISGKIDSWSEFIHTDDRDAILSSIHAAIDVGESQWSGEYRYRCSNGQYAYVLDRGHIIHNMRGEPVRMVGGMTDLTKLKQIQQDLARSNEDLQQFAYVASHDLQEPLRAVSGYAQLLKKRYGGKLDERADDLIKHTVEGVERMQTLINDLLEYSRVNTHLKQRQCINLEQPLRNALANLSGSIRESGAIVEIDPLPIVRADSSQIVLLFQNLLSNAIKFCRQQQPRIHVSAVRQRGEWHISVADDGIGIAPDYFDRVFVLFQRLHTRVEYPGTGIGLAMCKKIVERHDGRIWVESTPGKGSTFSFTLPEVED